jgi:hypothetical protein
MANSSCPGLSAKCVFALDIPGIHVLTDSSKKDVDGRDKSPAMTKKRILFKSLEGVGRVLGMKRTGIIVPEYRFPLARRHCREIGPMLQFKWIRTDITRITIAKQDAKACTSKTRSVW